MDRAAGILLHLTSLYNKYPIGDLGQSAYDFVDFLKASGLSYWQMLPVGPTDNTHSPYKGLSGFAGNPLLISLDRLVDQGLLNPRDINWDRPAASGAIDYSSALELKSKCLKLAYHHFGTNHNSDFSNYILHNKYWLNDFSLFSAIRDKTGIADWTRWDEGLRLKESQSLERSMNELEGLIRYYQFQCWIFDLQLQDLKKYCSLHGVHIIGDIPQYVDPLSPDVWAHPELFKVDHQGKPTAFAGVPPDLFSKSGQLWGVPVYHWDNLAREDYQWWIERFRCALKRCDLLRLDHFIGFSRVYEISHLATSALDGAYQPSAPPDFFDHISEALGGLPFIADDLGRITPEVEALRERLHIPGSWVLQFDLTEPRSTHQVVYTATHDNDTTLGWYEKLTHSERVALNDQLQLGLEDINWAMIHKAFASHAEMAIIPMQDILGLDSAARMNFPGTVNGNWEWRMGPGTLTEELRKKLLDLCTTYDRLERNT